MVPAQQRLEGNDLMVLGPDDGLVMEQQLVAVGRVAQFFADLALAGGRTGQFDAVEAILPAPAALGRIERKVRAFDQLVHRHAVIGGNRNPDRCTDRGTVAIERIGLRKHLDDLPGQLAQLPAVVGIGDDDLELVAPQTANFCRFGHDLLQPISDLTQQFITRRMTEAVIDMLELVEIHHQQRATALGCPEGGQRAFQPRGHAVTIGEPGQRVKLRHSRFVAVLRELRSDVLGTSAKADERSAAVVDRPARKRPPDLAPLVLQPHGLVLDFAP